MDCCPCPLDACLGGGKKESGTKKSIELRPFHDGSDSGSDEKGPETVADKAKGWFKQMTAPLQKMKDDYDKGNELSAKTEALKAGSQMRLLPEKRGEQPSAVRVALSADGAMVTWNGAGSSGVMALSAVREVKPVLAAGFFKSGDPVPGQFMLVADDQTVRFEAAGDEEKAQWMAVLEELAQQQMEAKSGRKVASQARRKMGLEERRRENERRKAEVLKTCSGGGMKHTAAAMMNRA